LSVPLFDHVKLSGEAVSKVLEPGERLLALGGFHQPLSGDESRLERSDDELTSVEQRFLRETGQRPRQSDTWFQGIDWGGVHINSDRIQRVLSGLSGAGAVDSTAGRMWRASKSHQHGLLKWAVTDQRLLLLLDKIGNPPSFEIHFSVDRTLIRSVRRRGKLLFQWGRVEVTFVDGSMIAFLAALLDVGAARQLVRALSDTRRSGDRDG
jgi:hypothetical protein